MRLALLAASLLVIAVAPVASAARCPPSCLVVDYGLYPDGECPGCVGASASAGIKAPEGCADCTTLGAGVDVHTDGDSVHIEAFACRGGFIHICPVDVDEDVPL